MRLYLSSYRMGDHPEYLVALAGEAGRRAVVIANAMDGAPDDVRRGAVDGELSDLVGLGFHAVELDLRDYFGDQQRLREDLGLLSEAFVPHYQSPGHPETEAIDLVVARYRAEGVAYRTLHDGQALLINGPDTTVV